MSEIMRQMIDQFQTMMEGKGKAYFMLNVKDGKMGKGAGAIKIIKTYKNGRMLVQCLSSKQSPESERVKLAEAVVGLCRDDIKAQADKMVVEALKHRRPEELRLMKQEIEAAYARGEKGITLSGSRGCVYLGYGKKGNHKDVLL